MNKPTAGNILIVDDEQNMRKLISTILTSEGYTWKETDDGRKALDMMSEEKFDLVIQDLKMPLMHGLELLRNTRERFPEQAVVIITAFSTWDQAVEAMRLGAYDYVKKPFDTNIFRDVIKGAIERYRRIKENPNDKSSMTISDMVGNTKEMQHVYDMIARVSKTDSTVLITGESGTGKELVARSLHTMSMRARGAFVPINCAAFSETLLESELFGHVKGSFTGAIADKKGVFEQADGGTLFLDELGEMNISLQVKLLRALETREVVPVGGSTPISVDVRFIAATNRNLVDAVKEGAFREDLYYRLNVIPIELPSLRERREDIPLLAGHFLAKYARQMNKSVSGFNDEAQKALNAYHWQGNVRELDNVIQRAVALSQKEILEREDFSIGVIGSEIDKIFLPDEGIDLEAVLAGLEKGVIEEALEKTDGNVTKAAELLKLPLRAMRYKVKKLKG